MPDTLLCLDSLLMYRGIRYHLKEHAGKKSLNRQELFNLRHSSFRSKIESVFGILKKKFKIPHFPYETQVKIVIACCILHNYVMQVNPDDRLINKNVEFDEGPSEILDEKVEFSTTNMTAQQQREDNKV